MNGLRRVLFVCTGNICRSAMAEQLLRAAARARGLDLEVASCGTAADHSYDVPGVVRRLLARKGLPAFTHTPRQASGELLRWADLVLVMTKGHRDWLLERFPDASGKVRLLREMAGFGEQDVADPFGLGDAAYERCLSELEETLDALLGREPA